MKKVLVLGGGFAGVEAAIYLRKEKYEVTLVSERDYFFIFPTSIWIPTREMEFKDVSINLEDLKKAHGFSVIIDRVTKISAKNNSVTLNNGSVLDDYDYLVVAMGAGKLKPKGVEHTLSICGAPQQSLLIRDELDRLIEKGSGKLAFGFGGNPNDSSAVRGGPGFELIFNVHHLLKKKGIRDNYELTFFAPMAEPGKKMGPKSLKMMDKYFDRLGIKKQFGKKITGFEKDGVRFEDGSKLESDFTMFIPAGNGHDVIRESDLPLSESFFVETDDFSNVIFKEDDMPTNIYAIGDTAKLEGFDWRAKQGHVAEVMARNLAFNIKERDKGGVKFKGYKDHLNILCVMDSGDGAAFIYRDNKRAFSIPMPIFGHWLKKGWGTYCRLSKLGKIPRIPGM